MKNFISFLFITFFFQSIHSQTIATSPITGTSFCQNESLSVSFTITGAFTSGNIFTAELSDATGNFASPITIGTLTGITAGTINSTLPNLLTTGTQYRIRVISSTPAVIGTDNSTDLTITGSATDPAIFGNNQWNVYCYSIASYTNNTAAFNFSDYRGMYTEPNQSFQSTDHWGIGGSPSSAAGYVGCLIGNNLQIVQYKREGFTCGNYQINIAGPSGEAGFDDAAKLVIDGVTVWSNGGCCQAVNNVFTGILGPTSQIEFVWSENGGGSYGRLTFVQIDYPNVSSDVFICAGSSTNLAASGATNYDWSTNSAHLVAPLNTASVTCSPPAGTANSIETYTVTTSDAASGCVLSADVDVTINPLSSTFVTPNSGSYCATGSVDVMASGANTYTYSPMTDVAINSASGNSATLTPTSTTTYTVTGTNNCATSTASVTVTVTVPAGNPNDFGLNTWNVYAYTGNNFNNYSGMYVDATLDFDTRTVWGNGSSPSNAPGYIGCTIPNNQHSFRYKREGFPCGYYSLDIPNHDDRVNLIIDGVIVFSQNSWFGNVYKSNVWQGYLDANSQIEYTIREFGGGSNGGLAFNYLFGPSNSPNETVWNGNVSTDWFDSNNWCSAVPTSSIAAIIPEGRSNYPSINVAGAIANDIDIKSSSSIAISGTNQLEITGSWINDGTFTPNNSTVLFTGNSLDSIAGVGNLTFNNLTLNKGITASAISINSDITIDGLITFTNGIIDTKLNKVIFSASSSAISASNNSHVNGVVQKTGNTDFIFPIGNIGSYRPIEISAPSNITDHFTASYFDQNPNNSLPVTFNTTLKDPSLDHVSTCEYWNLDRTNGTSNVFVTLSWSNTSCTINNMSDIVVARWDGSLWEDHGNGFTTGTNSNGTVTSALPIFSFSPFTLGSNSGDNDLPVELINFDAHKNNKIVDLTWQTESEVNNDYFTIERSKTGQEWNEVIQIEGAESGNSNTLLNYSTVDYTPFAGTSYYRLKQTDFNNQFEYSNVVAIQINEQQQIKITPNPVSEIVTISASSEELKYLAIYNLVGQNILDQVKILSIIENEIEINLSNLTTGTYLIKTKTHTSKIYKQ